MSLILWNLTRLWNEAPCHPVEASVVVTWHGLGDGFMNSDTCWSSTWGPMAFECQSHQRIMHEENLNVVDQRSSMIDERDHSQ